MNMRLEVIMLQSYKVYTLEDGQDFVLIDTLEYNNKNLFFWG